MKIFKTWSVSKEILLLAFVIFLGFFLRVVALVFFTHEPESDELVYISMALNLIKENAIIDNMGNHAMYNVGYPLFILTPIFFFLGEDFFAARVVNIV